MRIRIFACLTLLASLAFAQDKSDRYGVALNEKAYPQSTPQEALTSAIKAVGDKKVDYLVAHLADPDFVDDRVKRLYGGKFSEQVDDTRSRLDPFAVKQLERFAKDGKWAIGDKEAKVVLPDVKDRTARFVLKEKRWYLANEAGK